MGLLGYGGLRIVIIIDGELFTMMMAAVGGQAYG